MSKTRIELKAISSNPSAPVEESSGLLDADCQLEYALVFDRWEQHGEDRPRQTRCYSIHITLPGRTS